MTDDDRPKPRTKAFLKWKRLDESDITFILEQMGELGRKVRPKDKQQLKHRINLALTRITKLNAPLPSEKIAELEKIQSAVDRIKSALNEHNAKRYFPHLVDAIGGALPREPANLEALRADYPENDDDQLRIMSIIGWALPSDAAKAKVAGAFEAIEQLNRWAEFELAEWRERQANQPKRTIDVHKAHLMMALANIYQATFLRKPTASRTGPWCSFLATVLSRCTRKEEVDTNTAYSAWRKIQPQWRQLSSQGPQSDGRISSN